MSCPASLVTAGMVIGTIMEDSIVIASVLGLAAFAIGVWAFVELGCLRGTIGANQYGPDPLAADGSRRRCGRPPERRIDGGGASAG